VFIGVREWISLARNLAFFPGMHSIPAAQEKLVLRQLWKKFSSGEPLNLGAGIIFPATTFIPVQGRSKVSEKTELRPGHASWTKCSARTSSRRQLKKRARRRLSF